MFLKSFSFNQLQTEDKIFFSLMVLYVVLFVQFNGIAQLTTDDGQWSALALNIAEGKNLSWSYDITTFGIRHSRLASYIHSFSLMIFRSHISILCLIFFFNLLSHYCLYRIGDLLGTKRGGILLSLIFYFLPSMFVFYSLKTWQVAYLTSFVIFYIFFFFRHIQLKSKWDIYISAFFLGLSTHFHLSAFLLFPMFFFILFFFLRVPVRMFLNVLLIVLITLYPYVIQKPFFVLSVIPLFILYKIKNKVEINCDSQFYYIINIGLFIAGVIAYLIKLKFGLVNAFFIFLELLPANSLYIANQNLSQENFIGLSSFFSLNTTLFFISLFIKKRKTNVLSKIIFLNIAFLLFSFFFLGFVLNLKTYPHQWFLFAIPFSLMMMVDLINENLNKKLFFSICFLVVMQNVYYSISFASHVRSSGGLGWHLASFESKKEILDFIFSNSNNPTFDFVNVNSYGVYGWYYLEKYYIRDDRAKSQNFIIYEKDYQGKDMTDLGHFKKGVFQIHSYKAHKLFY